MGSLGTRLREERARLKCNQADFAALAGQRKNSLIKYEKDERSPDAKYLAALSEAGVDVLYVLTGRREAAHYQQDQSVVSSDSLERAITLVERGLRENNRELPPEKYAKLIMAVVDFLADDTDDVVANRIGNIIKLAV